NGDGASDALERNVISGNVFQGMSISASNDSTIAGNYIGTNAAGNASITNGNFFGINVSGGSLRTRIGTDGMKGSVLDAAERNVISGNIIGVGVQDTNTSGAVIAGNYIGLKADGSGALPNTGSGIELKDFSTLTRIGSNA